MFEVIERTINTVSKNINENTDAILEKNLNILDQFTIKGDDAVKSWKKIEQIIKK